MGLSHENCLVCFSTYLVTKVGLLVKLLVEESMERVSSTMLLQVHWFREECEEDEGTLGLLRKLNLLCVSTFLYPAFLSHHSP